MKKQIYTSAIIAAAGNGTRMKSKISKQFIKLDHVAVLARTLFVFEKSSEIDEIIIATRSTDIGAVEKLVEEFDIKKVKAVVCGGNTRQATIYRALAAVSGGLVLIHDGARPFVTVEQIDEVASELYENDAAALGIPVTDTLKLIKDNYITDTVDRSSLVSIQTPQGFKTEIIRRAHEEAIKNGLSVTDDCALCEKIGVKIKVVTGSAANIKITTSDDLIIAESLLKKKKEG